MAIEKAPLPGMTYLSGFGEVTITNGYIWYIEGPKESVIVDTGGKAEALEMLGILAKDVQTPENALGKLGLKCEDIETVVLTHLCVTILNMLESLKTQGLLFKMTS